MLSVFFVTHSEYPNGKMMHCKELKGTPLWLHSKEQLCGACVPRRHLAREPVLALVT